MIGAPEVTAKSILSRYERERDALRQSKIVIRREVVPLSSGFAEVRWIARHPWYRHIPFFQSRDFRETARKVFNYAHPNVPVPDIAADLEQYFDREYRPHFAEVDLKG